MRHSMRSPGLRVLGMSLICGLVAYAGGAHCSFGEPGDQMADDQAALAFLLTSQHGYVQSALRFSDNGTDRIDQFTNNQGIAIALSNASFFDIERVEVLLQPAPFAYRDAPRMQFAADESTRFVATNALTRNLSRVLGDLGFLLGAFGSRPLYAHEDTTVIASDSVAINVVSGVFVSPFSAGVNGNGDDGAGKLHYGVDGFSAAVRAGTIQRVIVHVRRLQLTGTVAGNAFTSLVTDQDMKTPVSCAASVAAGARVDLRVRINYSRLFRNLASSDQAGVDAALAANITDSHLLEEHQCSL
ncbi:MAG: hypothetical protein H7A21_14650 [Spirochaetales bacterium]|nr:hypothetical protein [Leptospiraceae bacterium]MCP5482673.1 hypothetical protein [Spirochaetales bacterium]